MGLLSIIEENLNDRKIQKLEEQYGKLSPEIKLKLKDEYAKMREEVEKAAEKMGKAARELSYQERTTNYERNKQEIKTYREKQSKICGRRFSPSPWAVIKKVWYNIPPTSLLSQLFAGGREYHKNKKILKSLKKAMVAEQTYGNLAYNDFQNAKDEYERTSDKYRDFLKNAVESKSPKSSVRTGNEQTDRQMESRTRDMRDNLQEVAQEENGFAKARKERLAKGKNNSRNSFANKLFDPPIQYAQYQINPDILQRVNLLQDCKVEGEPIFLSTEEQLAIMGLRERTLLYPTLESALEELKKLQGKQDDRFAKKALKEYAEDGCRILMEFMEGNSKESTPPEIIEACRKYQEYIANNSQKNNVEVLETSVGKDEGRVA